MESILIGGKELEQIESVGTEENSKTYPIVSENSTNETVNSIKIEEGLEMLLSAMNYLRDAGVEVFFNVDIAIPATAIILKDTVISDGKMMYLKVTHVKPE